MKHKALLITSAIFFLLVNTSYYWETSLGALAIPVLLVLMITFTVLAGLLIRQLYLAIKERFQNKERLLPILFVLIVLVLTIYKPQGLINFEAFEGKDLLVAERSGAANCTIKIKLKEDHTFVERAVCFEVFETKGDYTIKGDTIFFSNVHGRNEKDYFKFAVINKSKPSDKINLSYLSCYKNNKDTMPHEIWITKNNIPK